VFQGGATSSGWVFSFLGVPPNTELKNGEKCLVQAVRISARGGKTDFEYPKRTAAREVQGFFRFQK
jgi:hypothetical protein